MTSSELLRLALVYVHLMSCCVAIGAILTSDVQAMLRILRGQGLRPDRELPVVQTTVTAALTILWATGLFFIWQDSQAKGLEYVLSNPKLQGKLLVVAILTINGFILHYSILPMLAKAGSLLRLDEPKRTLAVLAGAVSAVSWVYAAFLGIARPLNYKFPLWQIMAAYPFLLFSVFVGVLTLTYLALRPTPTPHIAADLLESTK